MFVSVYYVCKCVFIFKNLLCSLRCWMTESPAAQLAHFITNIGLLGLVVSTGSVMLVLVLWKIRNRDEWRRNCVAFLSIWGLSCLFGTTWALAFFSFELSETALFLFCIINSLQGQFLYFIHIQDSAKTTYVHAMQSTL